MLLLSLDLNQVAPWLARLFYWIKFMNELTQEYLKSILNYDPETGIFKWNKKHCEHLKKCNCNAFNAQHYNKVAGSINKNGYLEIRINKKHIPLHKIATIIMKGYSYKKETDHINGIKTDNRLINLREANKSENQQNLKNSKKNNKLGMLGVCYRKHAKAYCAQITLNYKNKFLGYFETKEEASEAYIKAKRELHEFNTL